MRITFKLFTGLTALALAFSCLGTFTPTVQAGGPLYVSTTGNDAQDCLSPATACASLYGAVNKSVAGDTIYVASGTYYDTHNSDDVLKVTKDLTLLGGWNSSFTTQAGQTILDANYQRRVATVNPMVTANIDHFTFQNGVVTSPTVGTDYFASGINNYGSLTLTYCVFQGNAQHYDPHSTFWNNGVAQVTDCSFTRNIGTGLKNNGVFTGTRLMVYDNGLANSLGVYDHSGLVNEGAMTLNNSAIISNVTGGIYTGYLFFGVPTSVLTLNNTTIAGNGGYGLVNRHGSASLNNVTILNNKNVGIHSNSPVILNMPPPTTTLHNTLIAHNGDNQHPQDCEGVLISNGYNLVSTTQNCAIIAVTGDVFNVIPQVAPAEVNHPFAALQPTSPAIDAGDPAGCTDGQGNGFITDQLGTPRTLDGDQDGQATCDIGAVEYIYRPPSAPTQLIALSAPPRATTAQAAFATPIQAQVLDAQGIPVSNTAVLFTAPASGPTGFFASTGTFTASAVSNARGLVTAPTLTANDQFGVFTLTASSGSLTTTANFSFTIRASTEWYVSPAGSDQNPCQSPATACATLQTAFSRAFTGDTLYVAQGLYTGLAGSEVLLVDKDIQLSGGWDATFSQQTERSVIDGQNARRGLTVLPDIRVDIQHFTFRNGLAYLGGGLHNGGLLTLTDSLVESNQSLCQSPTYTSFSAGGGIYNTNRLWLERSILQNNGTHGCYYSHGGGLYTSGLAQINNSLIRNNILPEIGHSLGGGIYNVGLIIKINNSTLIDNVAKSISLDCLLCEAPDGHGGGLYQVGRVAHLYNTVLAHNSANANGPDCVGAVSSAGYNVLGNEAGCTFTATTGDKLNTASILDTNGRPLSGDTTLIDGSDPTGCHNSDGTPLTTDLSGAPRTIDGDKDGNARCDVGAFEYLPPRLYIPWITR